MENINSISFDSLVHAYYQAEGMNAHCVGIMNKLEPHYIDQESINNIIDSKLYEINCDELLSYIIEQTETLFTVEDIDPYLFLNSADSYALCVYCTEELVEDYKYRGIDIINGMKVYVLMSAFKTLQKLRSEGFTHLVWKKKPFVKEFPFGMDADFNFKIAVKMIVLVSDISFKELTEQFIE